MLYVNPLDSQAARGLDLASKTGREKLAYKELEHSFLNMLMDEMSKTVEKDSLFGEGPEADYQRQLMNDTLAGCMAESGQFGIAKQMQSQAAAAWMSKARPNLLNFAQHAVDRALMLAG